MTPTTTKKQLSPRDRILFALLLAAFFALLGIIAMYKPRALGVAGGITLLAWVISMALNRELKPRAQLVGLLIPGVLALIYGVAQVGPAAPLMVWIGGGLLTAAAFATPTMGQRTYDVWMAAAVPIGWSVSMIILGIVYYVVLTPTGLLMRLFGRDPMHRSYDRQASTYWIAHQSPADSQRYFRQF